MEPVYTLRENARAKRVSITVRPDGSVFVSKPRWASEREVEGFVARSAAWIARAKARFEGLPKTSRIETSRKEYKRYKQAALDFVERRIRHFNAHYHLHYRKLFIRNQKSRWGSCSHIGNLAFNYRLLFLPQHLADYIIVHELCHLRHMNHSRAFWAAVAESIPDHVLRRKELRKLERGLLID